MFKISILLLILLPLTVLGCSETESLTESDFEIRYNQLEEEALPSEMFVGAWMLQSLNYANDFSVFSELHWLSDIQDLEVAEYVVTLFFYPNGKWNAVLASSFADEPFIFDSTYLVGEYMVSDSEFMISGGKHGCFNVDKGTYTISDNYLTLKNSYLSALIFEKVIVEAEPETEVIRLWD